MKKMHGVFVAIAVFLCATVVSAALGPVTSTGASAGTVANANTVTVTVPGIVGVDLESNLVWDFGVYNPAANNAACAANNNLWPTSITCAAQGATTVNYDPTNNTDPAIGTLPLNSDQTSAAQLAALNGNKAIWLAFFCSRTGAGLGITTTMAALTGTATGINLSNFMFRGSTSQNGSGVGGAAFTSFGTGVVVSTGTLPATFGWTRADQFVTLALPNTATLGSGGLSSTIFYTITK